MDDVGASYLEIEDDYLDYCDDQEYGGLEIKSFRRWLLDPVECDQEMLEGWTIDELVSLYIAANA